MPFDINSKVLGSIIITITVLTIWIISIIEGNNIKKSPQALKYIEISNGLSVLIAIITYIPIFIYLLVTISYLSNYAVKGLFIFMATISGINGIISFFRAYLTAAQMGFKKSIISWINVITQICLILTITFLFLV